MSAPEWHSSSTGSRRGRRQNGIPPTGVPLLDANETLALITSEPAANAVRDGRVAGRDFHVRVTKTDGSPRTLRIEVTDTRTERVPPLTSHELPRDEESGRGLLIVVRLTTHWAVDPRVGTPEKTVWAKVRPR